MANDNNNINELVSYSDDDPTAEFEIPAHLAEAYDAALEADESVDTASSQSIEVLQSNLISSTEHIEQLQLELEDERARSLRLEEELHTEREAAQRLQSDATALQEQFERTEKDRAENVRKLAHMQDELDAANLRTERSDEDVKQIREATKSDRSRIRKLEKRLKSRERKLSGLERKLSNSHAKIAERDNERAQTRRHISDTENQLADAQSAIAELQAAADREQQANAELTDKLQSRDAELESAREEIDALGSSAESLTNQLEKETAAVKSQDEQLAAIRDKYGRLMAENEQLHATLQNDAESEFEKNQALIKRQSGLLSANAQEIRQLVTRIRTAEEYADDLRQKMQARTETAESAVNDQQRVATELDRAMSQIDELTASLELSERRSAKAEEDIRQLETSIEEESRRLRIELDTALETIAGQNTVNEQLLSDLYDNKGFRQALEIQLSESEEIYDRKIRHLEQQANRLRNQADDYERKLKNKDDAITALMQELANRSSTVEAIGEIENAIQEIDSIDQAQRENPAKQERVTRLLVGNTAGQELRFPLFKDRLTIGRTANNDIQLKARFISRRHAVIVTDGNDTRIVDWGSKNGVFVNEKRIAEQVLCSGDIVTIGMSDFRYEERPKR